MYSTSYLQSADRLSLAASFRNSPYYPQDPANLRGKVPSWARRPNSAGPRPASPAATQALATRHAAAARLTQAFMMRDVSPSALGTMHQRRGRCGYLSYIFTLLLLGSGPLPRPTGWGTLPPLGRAPFSQRGPS